MHYISTAPYSFSATTRLSGKKQPSAKFEISLPPTFSPGLHLGTNGSHGSRRQRLSTGPGNWCQLRRQRRREPNGGGFNPHSLDTRHQCGCLTSQYSGIAFFLFLIPSADFNAKREIELYPTPRVPIAPSSRLRHSMLEKTA